VHADRPQEEERGDQFREVGSRPGGGLSVLSRCLRILSGRTGSVMTGLSQRWRAAAGLDDDLHGAVTSRADQGVNIVDLLDEPGPCGPLRGPWAWMVAARPPWPMRGGFAWRTRTAGARLAQARLCGPMARADGRASTSQASSPSGARRTRCGWRDQLVVSTIASRADLEGDTAVLVACREA
jgi:hypothetical protein